MRLGIFALISSLLFTTIASAQTAVPDRRLSLIRDFDLPGGDIQSIFDTTLEACEKACLANTRCVAFTFNTRSNSCFPKSELGEQAPYEGAFSGVILPANRGTVALGERRKAELDFLTDGLFQQARNQALDLTNKHVPNGWSATELMQSSNDARANGNIVSAYRFAGAATVVSDAADHWIEYARLALAIQTDNSSEKRRYQQRAYLAAINGYLRATTGAVQVNALTTLADLMELRGEGRNAIPALRLAQSIQPRNDTEIALEKAIAKYGFRIVEHEVESNPARPRICARFSEDLVQSGVDYATYVRVQDADLNVEADQRRICIEGVNHGTRYDVSFREGLPAASGESLIKTVNLNLYVRDRAPSARFPGRAYILPATGDITLPIETVNVTELDLSLKQVSDRSILRAIQDNYFGRPLSAWEENFFDNDIAVAVWDGTGQVKQELNKDVTTRLPMTDVVGDLEPGIYALQARIPGADPYDNPAATQWFVVSDLGLATLTGADGLHVFLRGLGDAEPRENVEITLLSRSNSVLGTSTTDAMGYAQFVAGQTKGTGGAAPAMIIAKSDDDISFLSLKDPEFDLSDRGVEGRAPAGPIDTFITTDRGAYRAGDVINATVLTRDATAEAIEGLPLTAILHRPDGVEYSRQLSQNEAAGGHVFAFPTTGTAPRGSWRIDIHVDPKAAPVANARVLVEDFLPERIDFDVALPNGPISSNSPVEIGIDAKYLFGAPAGDLPIEGEVFLRTASKIEAFPGFVFGRHDNSVQGEVFYFPSDEKTDSLGRATIFAELPELQQNFKPLEAIFATRIAEGSGRPVERKVTAPIAPTGPVIGIKPKFDGDLPEFSDAIFDLIALDQSLTPLNLPVRWTVNRVRTEYQWYRYSGSWNWEPVTTRSKVAEGDAQLGETPVSVTAPVEWGEYEIKVESLDGTYIAASTRFYAGWNGGADASKTPDFLDVSLDAKNYRPGDTAKLRIEPRYAGKAIVTVMSNRLVDMVAVDVSEDGTIVDLDVTDEWGAGAYVAATLIRPMDVAAGRNPARSIGLNYAQVDPSDHVLNAEFLVDDEAAPRETLAVELKVDGIDEGETAFVTIAAVDVGILNLTRFDAPDPNSHYFGQRRLGMGIRDVYGRLIDGLNGSLGSIRSGGDASVEQGLQSPPPTEELLAFFSGPITVDSSGVARTEFQLPSFNGTVKLMAVAWSKSRIGKAEKDVLVRDPVVVTASLPRFMAPGDRSRLLLEVVHATGPTGRFGLEVKTNGVRLNRAVPSRIVLSAQEKKVLSLPITAALAGNHSIDVNLTTPDGKLLQKTLNIPVQVNDPISTRTSRFNLASGDTFTLNSDVFAGMRLGTASATLAAGPIARLDAPGLLQSLDKYPYGCTEQITSKAMPLLYLDDVANAMGLNKRDDIQTRIDRSIERVLTNQSSNGSFGLWYASSGDLWLDAYVSDFLSRAKSKGYEVPDIAFRTALDNLRNRVNYAPDFDTGGEGIAYALYVLSREGAASVSDLRYYADVKRDAFSTPLAVAQIGAALASYGDPSRADRMFAKAGQMIGQSLAFDTERRTWRSDYGTNLRDRAAVLTLAAEAGSNAINRADLLASIAPVEGAQNRSTQEQVWSLLAAHSMLDTGDFGALSIDGSPIEGPLVRVVEDQVSFDALAIKNEGNRQATITLTTFGVPEVPEPATGNGYAIERRYFTLDGNPADPSNIKQGTRLVTVLTIKPFSKIAARLMVNDPLPAGLEIDNPNLLRGGDISALDWLDLHTDTRNTEFRQERFLAAVDWRSEKEFRLGYIVRAVSPGEYHHPAASVEDMYRPDFRAQSDAGRVVVTD